MWLGYLEEYPDYMTQGQSIEELEDNLKDIFKALTSGRIPCVRRVAELQVSCNICCEDIRRCDMKDLKRITFTPGLIGGQACIRGMRIPVSLVVNLIANGMSVEEIIKEYPDIEPDDIKEALQYASRLAREELHPAAV